MLASLVVRILQLGKSLLRHTLSKVIHRVVRRSHKPTVPISKLSVLIQLATTDTYVLEELVIVIGDEHVCHQCRIRLTKLLKRFTSRRVVRVDLVQLRLYLAQHRSV